MPTIADILRSKEPHIHAVDPDMSVLEATQVMNAHRIGAVLVKADEQVLGIFTERDVLRRVVSEQRDPRHTAVREVMTERVLCCQPEASLEEVAALMRERRIRHVPVRQNDGSICGMISIGDINAHTAHDHQATIQFLSDYIYGRV